MATNRFDDYEDINWLFSPSVPVRDDKNKQTRGIYIFFLYFSKYLTKYIMGWFKIIHHFYV